MTKGSPGRQMLLFSIPLLLGNILQQMYNTVDSMVVGNFIGSGALAAVGTSTPIINLMVAFFLGLSAGASILFSQAYGAKDWERLNTMVHTVFTLMVLAAVVVAAVGVGATPAILRLLHTPLDVFEMAATYMRVTFIGIVSVMLFNVINSILQGTGDSRSPFMILLISCAINIALDLLFVVCFGWGVAGVAWATVIAQICAAVFGVWRINRPGGVVRIRLRACQLSLPAMGALMRLGVPTGTQNSLQSVGNIMVQSVINGFGPVIMAANIAVIKVDSFCTMPMMTFATAITVFVGQNAGAGRHDRIRAGTRAVIGMSVGTSIVISTVLYFFGAWPLRLFTQEADVVQAGMDKFHIVAPFYCAMAIFGVLSGVIRGSGQTVIPMMIGITTMFIGRVPVAFFLSQLIGANGIHWSLSVQWALEAVVITLYYFFGGWRKKAKVEAAKRDTPLPAR